jgi:hypothetical protein
LPGLNELLAAAKSGRGKGNGYSRLKRCWTDFVSLHAREARLPRLERARFAFRWVEASKRRDPDNLAAGGRKLILDGLVAAGVLPDDGWANVAGWEDVFEVGAAAGVEVTLTPV